MKERIETLIKRYEESSIRLCTGHVTEDSISIAEEHKMFVRNLKLILEETCPGE